MADVLHTPPIILTDANWQKEKGAIAKLAGETGIGSALKELDKRHKAVDWTKITAEGYGKLHSVEEVDEAVKKAKSYYAKYVQPLRDQALAISKLASATADKFKKNRMIPASSAKHVQSLGDSASQYATELKSLDAEFATFGEYKKKLEKQIADQRKMIGPSMAKLAKGIKDALANPTREQWIESMQQNCRSVCNGLKVVPEWNAAFWKTWEKNDGTRFLSQLDGTTGDVQKIQREVLRILEDLKKLKVGLGI